MAAGALIAGAVALRPSDEPPVPRAPWSEVDVSLDRPTPSAERRPAREVYPYSVIPGGVYTAAELADSVTDDPAVAEHYRDIAPSEMRVGVVDTVRDAYMSYRVGDRIYWTRRKLPLRQGERILTDGDVSVRARCGNRLSDVPMLPISDSEPGADEFEREPAPLSTIAGVAATVFEPSLVLVPDSSVPAGMAPGSDGENRGSFFDGGGFYGGVGVPPMIGEAPSLAEGDGKQALFAFVLPTANEAGHPRFPDQSGRGDLPFVDVEIPPFAHVDSPGGGSTTSSVEFPGNTLLVPITYGGSDSELPPAVVPEPTTLALLGTGLLLGFVRRRQTRARSKDAD